VEDIAALGDWKFPIETRIENDSRNETWLAREASPDMMAN
jgi:hypothetical protein